MTDKEKLDQIQELIDRELENKLEQKEILENKKDYFEYLFCDYVIAFLKDMEDVLKGN